MLISIILPTRKRPSNLIRLLDSIYKVTSRRNRIEIASRIDEDDIDSLKVLFKYKDKFDIRICVGTRELNHGNLWNDAWKIARGELFMMCGDDFIFHTRHWDITVIHEFSKHKNRIAYVYGEDGIQHGQIGTHGIVSREWTDKLGYFVPYDFNVFYHDTWLTDLADRIGKKIYIPELYFEHAHFSIGKNKFDEVSERMSINGKADHAIWDQTFDKRAIEAEKLRSLIE